MSRNGAVTIAVEAAVAAKREAVAGALLAVHRVLLWVAAPLVLAVYGVQLAVQPSWQFAVVFLVAASGCASWFLSARFARQKRAEAATLVLFVSVVTISAVAGVFRQHTLPMAQLAIVVSLAAVWLGHPRGLVSAGGVAVAVLLTLEVVAFYGWAPAVAAPPWLDVMFNAGVTVAVMVAFILLLKSGSVALEVPFARLEGAFATILEAQPALRRLSDTVHSTVAVVASAAQQQASSAEQAAVAAGSLEKSLVKTGAATTEARAIADSTRENSSQAGASVQRVAERLEAALAAVDGVVGTIGGLAQRSERTEDLIRTIEEVHSTVKLLSVNAALEATRAGESGRAIGIVADRMRDLIVQTEGSLKQGRELLVGIRREAAGAARGAGEAAGDLRRHLEGLREAATALNQVVSSFGETSENIATIAEATVAQREQIEAVKEAAQQLRASAVSLTGSASSLVDSATQLSRAHASLDGVVTGGAPQAAA